MPLLLASLGPEARVLLLAAGLVQQVVFFAAAVASYQSWCCWLDSRTPGPA